MRRSISRIDIDGDRVPDGALLQLGQKGIQRLEQEADLTQVDGTLLATGSDSWARKYMETRWGYDKKTKVARSCMIWAQVLGFECNQILGKLFNRCRRMGSLFCNELVLL